MNDPRKGELPIESESDIVRARKVVRQTASVLGFGITDVTRIVTAASELTRNICVHARRGVMRWRVLNEGHLSGLELVFADQGPGIPDIAKAMQMGFTTGQGLGLGLPGSKRLMDEMTIESTVGQGTTIAVRKWLKP